MRQVTATEKYRAVNEGKMTQKAFVRDMRIAHPSLISQWSGYSDTVKILKNKGFISEKSGVDTYDSRYELNISPDSIDRGVRYELQALGHDPATCDDKEAQEKSKERAVKNLKKDPLHYINLLAKESSHVDKNDKPKEVKRGAADKDTFNDLKKATLKEGYTEEQINSAIERIKEKKEAEKKELPKSFADQEKDQIEKDAMKAKGMIKEDPRENIMIVAKTIREKYGEIPGFTGILKDFLQTHQHEIKAGEIAAEDAIAEFDNFIDANYDRLDEKDAEYNTDPNLTMHIDDDEWEKEMGRGVNEMSPEAADAIAFLATAAGIKGASHIAGKLLAALEAGKLGEKGKALAQDIHNLAKEEVEEGQINERGFHVMRQIKGIIQDMAADFDGDELGAAQELMEAIGQEYGIDFEFGAGPSRQAEAKGKDHDGDGDIDSDDYMAAKDMAIKKAMGKNVNEAIKAIISKVLEEGTINEAATNELARIADDYAGFEGMKSAILDLQNIVTDIEGYYDKTRDKIQKVYDRLGEIRNEEGLKVGGFLAPAIEAAFNKDLRPVTKVGFTGGLETPKVRTISSAEIDAARAAGEIEEEPKQTMFTPIAESKKKK